MTGMFIGITGLSLVLSGMPQAASVPVKTSDAHAAAPASDGSTKIKVAVHAAIFNKGRQVRTVRVNDTPEFVIKVTWSGPLGVLAIGQIESPRFIRLHPVNNSISESTNADGTSMRTMTWTLKTMHAGMAYVEPASLSYTLSGVERTLKTQRLELEVLKDETARMRAAVVGATSGLFVAGIVLALVIYRKRKSVEPTIPGEPSESEQLWQRRCALDEKIRSGSLDSDLVREGRELIQKGMLQRYGSMAPDSCDDKNMAGQLKHAVETADRVLFAHQRPDREELMELCRVVDRLLKPDLHMTMEEPHK